MDRKIRLENIVNISLIGFMGSGKTTTGRILAERLKFLFIDLDEIIEMGMDMPVSDVFEKYGEEYFRNIEASTVKKLYLNENCIFACGGGVITRHGNTEIIKKNGAVVFLHVSPETALERLKNTDNRPLLKSTKRFDIIIGLMEKREGLYRAAADYTVETDIRKPKEVAEEIIRELKE